MDNQPALLAEVREDERPTPPVADAPPFTLTAPVSQRQDHQPSLFNAPADLVALHCTSIDYGDSEP